MSPAEALARLVAGGKIKSAWAPGMRCWNPAGETYFRVIDGPDHRGWFLICFETGNRGSRTADLTGCPPDLTDPLTVRGLLLLAREAWGIEGLCVRRRSAGEWWVWEDSDQRNAPFHCLQDRNGRAYPAVGPTEAAAIIIALHAAAEALDER